mgnify:CR=1 FL=1
MTKMSIPCKVSHNNKTHKKGRIEHPITPDISRVDGLNLDKSGAGFGNLFNTLLFIGKLYLLTTFCNPSLEVIIPRTPAHFSREIHALTKSSASNKHQYHGMFVIHPSILHARHYCKDNICDKITDDSIK